MAQCDPDRQDGVDYGCVDGLLVPTCGAGEDCRQCACPGDELCLQSTGWRCGPLRWHYESCALERHECEPPFVCYLSATGQGECQHLNLLEDCFRTDECGRSSNNLTCSVNHQTQQFCEPLTPGYELFEPCFRAGTGPPPLTAGVCE